MKKVIDDGFGRMTTYTRFTGAVVTEYRQNGYYWAYPIHTSRGGTTAFLGPFPTRNAAKQNELDSIKKRRR